MTWLRFFTNFLALSVLLAPTLAAVCPNSCICKTTRDGLHRATCSSLTELYKFTIRQKHHNINILDLSHNNITKVSHELDRLTEIVTLDLSTNGIQNLNKFLHNAKKLVHLSLANNRLETLSLRTLPTSISSLDLTNNLLRDVPSDISHLSSLEHFELEGNPLDCSCENIVARDRLLAANVYIDNVKCASPDKLKRRSWLELKTKDICKVHKTEQNIMDIMMGDQPIDAIRIGAETTALKSVSLIAGGDLNDGKVIQGANEGEDDDSLLFMKVRRAASPAPFNDIEGSGSGDTESTTVSDIYMEAKKVPKLDEKILASDEMFPAEDSQTTVDPLEGSGESSGFIPHNFNHFYDEETTTPILEALNPGPVQKIFEDDTNKSTTEFPMPDPPKIYMGGNEWNTKSSPSDPVEKSTSSTPRDTTVSEQIRVTQVSQVLGQVPASKDTTPPHKTGTYVCIAIIVILLVGLIGFAIIKGQMRKRRDRRIIRQQKRDVENASKEMVDMNKSLLGKPAPLEHPGEKRVNGKYELVPTHETFQKKNENGDVPNGGHSEKNLERTDSPRDTNQNKSSSRDNNLAEGSKTPQQETSFDSAPASPDSRKDTHSLSSEDIFVPVNEEDTPRLNGNAESDVTQPLINGDPNTESDFLSPSREYVPVYSPDMGRVRIKMTETPKPKTPVLVTRSRSNAGDIIITPADGNVRKSTT
ncbi:hypothetical protein K1T71_002046 [Dendrolimus kikuchii]|uniref:Uncharacterized protein n=1 Tax=Dendrolimus kikuchii TaxID=765133 RepID=A0ACC1DGX7_9NEOP|nr:hypothetical protein K1T71_002046 [Dendrolimus kikuchii]